MNRLKVHGLARHPAYDTHAKMKSRCDDPRDKDYPEWGGRGIRYVEEWRSIEGFVAWVKIQFPPDGKIPKGLSIERRDNDGPYSPDNCYFATMKQQNNNRRNNRLITFNGETKTQAQWGEEKGLSSALIDWRLNHGWSIEKTLTTRPRKW